MDVITSTWFMVIIVSLAIWELAWKLPALWRSARRNQMAWFVCIGVINTLGILPIIYLIINRDRDKE